MNIYVDFDDCLCETARDKRCADWNMINESVISGR